MTRLPRSRAAVGLTPAVIRLLCVVAALAVLGLLAVGQVASAPPSAATTPAAPAVAAPAVAAPAVARATGAVDPLPVQVGVQEISPAALSPTTELTVSGTVHNTGRTTLSSLQVVLRLDWRLVTDRRELAEWAGLDARNPANGTRQASVPLGRPLAPGETAGFVVTMRGDAVQLPVSAEGFGPRRMCLEIQEGPVTGGTRVGIVRTFAVWDPVRKYRPTRLALLIPVAQGRQPVDPDGRGGQVPQLWRATGRISRLLAATTDPAFSYAVDPALLQAALAGQTPQPVRPRGITDAKPSPSGSSPSGSSPSGSSPSGSSPSGSSPSVPAKSPAASASFDPATAADAKAVLDQLTAAVKDRDLRTLPYADPDVAALAAVGRREVLDAADAEAGLVTKEIVGQSLPGGLVWPATARVDAATAGLAAGAPGRRLVLPASTVVAAEPGDTAPARARLSLEGGQVEALLTDDALSAALAAGGGESAALAIQRVLAETASVTAAHPEDSPVVVATVPRDWNPDPTGVISLVAALRTAGWVQLDGTETALAQTPVVLGRPRLSPPPTASGTGPEATTTGAAPVSLEPAHVRIVANQLGKLTAFSPALDDDGRRAVLRPIRRSALEMLSTSWIARQRGVGPARGILGEEVTGLYGGVSVVAGSSANLLAKSGQLPVTVENRLSVPVTVILRLHPTSRRVADIRPVRVQLEKFKSLTVLTHLEAYANGEVRIEARLTAPGSQGAVISTATPIRVRVYYDWASRGLPWVIGVLGLLLVAGLFRSVRRGRVRVSPDSIPDPDDVGREPTPTREPEPPREPLPGREGDPDALPDAQQDARQAAGSKAAGSIFESAPRGVRGTPGGVALAARDVPPTVISSPVLVERDEAGGGVVDPPDDELGDGPGDGPGTGPGGSADGDGQGEARSTGLLSSSAIMAAGTLASRVLGLVRTSVLAWAIGVQGLSADAFALANTLPNSLLVIVGGGALNAVLVPQIVRAAKRSDGGKDYLDRLITLALLVLGGATVLATVLAPALVWLYGGFFKVSPEQEHLATAFAVWCLPQIFFYGLYTVYGQVLNARGSFGPYMWAPVVNNIVAIAGTVVFVVLCGSGSKAPEWWSAGPVALLAGTATLGIVAQALVLIPALRRSGYRWRPRWGWRGVGLRTAGSMAGWTFAGAAVGQLVGFVVISNVATYAGRLGHDQGLDVPGVTIYNNAFLLFMLPHSLVAVSLVTALFTRMSASARDDRTDEVRADVALAIRLTGLATVLATVAFVVLGSDLPRAVFPGNGQGDADALALVTATMIIGLVPFSAQYLFSRVFYAYEDARTPFWIQVGVIAVWAGGSLISAAALPPAWIVAGVGVSMSVSNLVGAALSMIILRRRLGGLDGWGLAGTHLRLGAAAAVAGAAGWAVRSGVHALTGDGLAATYPALAAASVTMLIGYSIMLRALRVRELDVVLGPLLRRFSAAR